MVTRRCEFDGCGDRVRGVVVEGGLKLDASKGGEMQMVRSTHAAYFNIKLVRQQKVRSMHERT